MKKLKTTASLLLILLLLLSSVYPAAADDSDDDLAFTGEYTILGDIDIDGEVTIIDGTLLQLHLVELEYLTDDELSRADLNLDGYPDVTDITHLQRYLANYEGSFYLGLEVGNAIILKQSDEEAKRLAEEAKAAETAKAEKEALAAAKAKQAELDKYNAEVAAMKQRTLAAKSAYLAKYKEILAQEKAAAQNAEAEKKAKIDASIKNYKKTKGVDISEFNGNVDFNKLKAAGYTFVMIRCGWGSNLTSQDDAMFEKNVKKAEAAGMPWGVYLYSYALNVNSAKSEVQHTLRLLKGKKPTMPVAFDLEEDEYKDGHGMTNKALHDVTVTYMKGIKDAGYYPILYTGYDWLTGPLKTKDVVGTYDIWYAQWYTVMQYNTSKVGMWQYGGEVNYLESPYIKGLSGMFDKDYCFKNYPVLITAYGYNNHPGMFDKKLAPTAENDAELYVESGEKIPEEYKGVMGESFKKKFAQTDPTETE